MRLPALLFLLAINFTHAQSPPPIALPDKAALLREVAQKADRINAFLRDQRLGGVLLSNVNNTAWATAGLGDTHILLSAPTGPASLLILADGRRFVVGPKTETDHLLVEGLGELGYQPLAYTWYDAPGRMQALVNSVANNQPIGTDVPADGLKLIDGPFAQIRYELTDSEVQKYRWVCRQASEAVAQVCRTIKPGMTERAIEAQTASELQRRGLQPTVVLVGVDDRLDQFYHYPPTDKVLQRVAFVNVCARRWGLTTSVGRYVHFGAPPAALQQNMRASADVSAAMQAATKPGARAADIFAVAQRQYAQHGMPDQWQRIHVGGGIGYAEREWVASANSTEMIRSRQAFAWNPFTPGALSFDTVWLRPDGTLENLTGLPDWPSLSVLQNGVTYRMPDVLVR